MTLTDISNLRLISQKINGSKFNSAREIISWMGAMQAQDFIMSKWAIGTRLLNVTESIVEEAINKGEIIRTHLMRPTWHYVSAEDVYWMIELTARQIKKSLKSRHIGLELSEETIAQGNRLIERSFYNKKDVTREEIANEFEREKIRTNDNRLAHFLLLAELDGLICSGRIINNKLSYALLNERVPHKRTFSRAVSLAELAKRYFTSHGPATINDFAWWSGLSLTDARKGLEMVKTSFVSETIDDQLFWMAPNLKDEMKRDKSSVCLLPAYDEYLISYRDRNASFSEDISKRTVSFNGIFRPVIVIDGKVAGLWKRILTKDRVIIEVDAFQDYGDDLQNLIKKQAYRYGLFLKEEVELGFKNTISL